MVWSWLRGVLLVGAIGLGPVHMPSALAAPALLAQVAVQHRHAAAEALVTQGLEQFRQGQLQAAIATYSQALAHYQQLAFGEGDARARSGLAQVQIVLGNYPEALVQLEAALAIYQGLGDRLGEGEVLNLMGLVQRRQGNYGQALALHQQALVLARAAQAQAVEGEAVEGEALHNLGAIAAAQGNYRQALSLYDQALEKRRQGQDPWGEGRTLHNLGNVYVNQSDYDQALSLYEQALALRQRNGDRLGVQRTLQAIGQLQRTSGRLDDALLTHQQALTVLQETGDRASAGVVLSSIGSLHDIRGESALALEAYQQALAIARDIGDRSGIAATQDSLGGVAYNRGRYADALTYYQQALGLHWQLGDRLNEGRTLINLAGVYDRLGRYPQALYALQQALEIHQDISNPVGAAQALQGLGDVQLQQGDEAAAMVAYEQALAITQTQNNPRLKADVLNRLGGIYAQRSQLRSAITAYEEALALRRATGDRPGEGATLNNLALVAIAQGELDQAQTLLHQALGLFRDVGDRSGERTALGHLGAVLEQLEHPRVAIALYKAAVNVTESIRAELGTLARVEQQSYLASVADLYRRLADLLLQENRVLEAQRVIDLLKVQELDDYLHRVRGNGQTAVGVETLPPEQALLDSYTNLQDHAIRIGDDIAQLRQTQRDQGRLPLAQEQRLAQLTMQQQQLTRQFVAFTRRPDVVARVQQLGRATQNRTLGLASLRQVANNLGELEPGTVLVYPLVLDDRIELILTTANSPPIRRTTQVSRLELNQAIAQFRSSLENPRVDAQSPARQLYDWLIQPLEADLAQANAQTIIYAPDDQLRYIPLAALHDGDQWLVERFRTNNITAASLTDFSTPPRQTLRILAGAFTQGQYQMQVGERQMTLSGLPYAEQEVEALSALVPDVTAVFNQNFSRAAVVPQLNSYNTVHFATHAAFLPGQPEDSFILLGDGDRITLRDVETEWFLTNVDLVVLSACETGIGGTFGTGEEILGFGYLMQDAGARAAIASLWPVNDGGTQALMVAFYRALTAGATKAAALQAAQKALITGDGVEIEDTLAFSLMAQSGSESPASALTHPYYWAPFILIGNGS